MLSLRDFSGYLEVKTRGGSKRRSWTSAGRKPKETLSVRSKERLHLEPLFWRTAELALDFTVAMGQRQLMARRNPQMEFKGNGFTKPDASFGGSLAKTSNPKTKRPLESKLPLHLVLRAKKGGMRKPKAFKQVNDIVRNAAQKYDFTIYSYANMGNHLHILLELSKVSRWSPFIREVTGRIAQLMKELKLASAGFWLYRPFTRIVKGWQKAFRTMKKYLELNRLEAEGFINRKETKTLKDLRAIWGDG